MDRPRGAAKLSTRMALEQDTGSEDVDYSLVDIYVVGTTLYNQLTGSFYLRGISSLLFAPAN